MGFFNGILRGLGFEGEKKTGDSKQVKEQNNTFQMNSAEYDLTEKKENQKPEEFVPKSEKEVQQIVEVLKTGKDVKVNFENLEVKEYIRALDFMSGAIYALSGKIKKISERTYLFCVNLG